MMLSTAEIMYDDQR